VSLFGGSERGGYGKTLILQLPTASICSLLACASIDAGKATQELGVQALNIYKGEARRTASISAVVLVGLAILPGNNSWCAALFKESHSLAF
jgi:hypothetical protein